MSKRNRRRNRQAGGAIQPAPPQQIPNQTGGAAAPAGFVVAHSSFSGPLPPPTVLEQYDEVFPGAAERIFKMAETQAAHRQDLEKRVVSSDINKSYLGLASGLTVAVVAIVGGCIVAYSGQPIAGAAIGGAPVATMIWAFLHATNARRAERDEKSRSLVRRG